MSWEHTLHLTWADLDGWDKLTQIFAVIVGGIAAYFKFFKVRTYAERLELSIDLAVSKIDYKTSILTINSGIKNIGTSKIETDPTRTAIILYTIDYSAFDKEYDSASWTDAGVYLVFEADSNIESGESISDQTMIFVPNSDNKCYKCELNVYGGNRYWIANKVFIPPKKDNQRLFDRMPRRSK